MASGIPAVMTLPCSGSPTPRRVRTPLFTPFHQSEYIKCLGNCKVFFGKAANLFVGDDHDGVHSICNCREGCVFPVDLGGFSR